MYSKSRFLALTLAVAALAGCGSEPMPVGSVTVEPGEIALPHAGWRHIALDWRMSAPLDGLEGELRVLLHVVGADGEIERTFDHPFPGDWEPGAEKSYSVPVFQSAISLPLELGDYRLRAGLYDAAGRRWTLERGEVATVRAVEPGDGFPELSFSVDWLPIEAGVDRQILARRWLGGDGAMRVRGYGSAGTLWLRLGIPAGSTMQELVLEEGATEQTVRVRAECSGFEAVLSGRGSHTLEIPLAPGADGPAECKLDFSANYVLISKDNNETRTFALENVAWSVG